MFGPWSKFVIIREFKGTYVVFEDSASHLGYCLVRGLIPIS